MAETRRAFGSTQGGLYLGNLWPKQEELLVLYRGVCFYLGNQWPKQEKLLVLYRGVCFYPGNQWPKQEELLVLFRGVCFYPENQWPKVKQTKYQNAKFVATARTANSLCPP